MIDESMKNDDECKAKELKGILNDKGGDFSQIEANIGGRRGTRNIANS